MMTTQATVTDAEATMFALEMVDAFRAARRPMTAAELAEAMSLPESFTQAAAEAAVERCMARKVGRRYRPTPAMMSGAPRAM